MAPASLTSCQKFGLIFGLFTLGTYNTVITKVLFTLQSIGKDGTPELFVKPAFGNWTMFLGMMLSIPVYRCSKRRSAVQTLDAPLMQKQAATPLRNYFLVAVPAIFDLVAMGLSLIGIILIPASIWQMLRGAEIVFAAILTRFIVGTVLCKFHWLGVCFAMMGIALVSAATLASSDSSRQESSNDEEAGSSFLLWVGILITLGSQVITAAQIIIEEKLLMDLDMNALLIVGVEGVWGFLGMTFVVYPLLWLCPGPDHGHAEDIVDTYYLVKNDWLVQLIAVADMVSCLAYNVIGMKVTETMSGVMRTMLEATRTLMVWIFNLGWHYLVDPDSKFGESWTTWSYLELLGFLFLILGQMTYAGMIKWPGLEYPLDLDANQYVSPGAVMAGAFPSPHGIPSRATSRRPSGDWS